MIKNNQKISSATPFMIEKKAPCNITLENYFENKILTFSQYYFICNALAKKKNIVICGEKGSGKTTLLNAMIEKIGRISHFCEKILILTESTEPHLKADNIILMQTNKETSMDCLIQSVTQSHSDRMMVDCITSDIAALALLTSWHINLGGIAIMPHASAKDTLSYLTTVAQSHLKTQWSEMLEHIGVILHLAKNANHPMSLELKSVVDISGFKKNGFLMNEVD